MRKITPIFGPQELFDNAPEHVEVIRFNDYSREYLWGDLNTIQLLTFEELKAIPIVAMRRIIQEPKRWTVEDQKAGRLPEVGSEVILRTTGEIATINAANKNMVCLTFSDGGFSPFNVERIDPIESPEEKAERLRNEWVNKAYVDFHRLGCELEVLQKEQIKQIYDALLSGELTMPGKVDE